MIKQRQLQDETVHIYIRELVRLILEVWRYGYSWSSSELHACHEYANI